MKRNESRRRRPSAVQPRKEPDDFAGIAKTVWWIRRIAWTIGGLAVLSLAWEELRRRYPNLW